MTRRMWGLLVLCGGLGALALILLPFTFTGSLVCAGLAVLSALVSLPTLLSEDRLFQDDEEPRRVR